MDPAGINSSREAKIRYLMDFCELRIGQQGSRARTRARSFGENKTNIQGQRGNLGTNTEESSFRMSSPHLLSIDGWKRECSVCLVVVFPNT